MLVDIVESTIQPLWYFVIFARNGFAIVGGALPVHILSIIWSEPNIKRLLYIKMDL